MSDHYIQQLQIVLNNLLMPNSAVIKQAESDLAYLQSDIFSFLKGLCALVASLKLTSFNRRQNKTSYLHSHRQTFRAPDQ